MTADHPHHHLFLFYNECVHHYEGGWGVDGRGQDWKGRETGGKAREEMERKGRIGEA